MSRERLYIVHGTGNDKVGLVRSIATPIAQAGGNIVDLRQDVLHGLFTLFIVVDLSDCSLHIEEFETMVKRISEDTGLRLTVDKYHPVARSPEKENLLLILLGTDRPGIVASVSETLSKYQINIEFSQMIAREGTFLMELLTDIGHCSIPLDNLRTILERTMGSLGIKAIFQTEDVFNKKKRMIIFDVRSSFIDRAQFSEIFQQTGLKPEEISSVYSRDAVLPSLQQAASLLEGFPVEVMNRMIEEVRATPGTMELLQTLKIMGYTIVLVSNGFSLFTEALKGKLGLNYCFGVDLAVDDDSQTIAGEIAPDKPAGGDLESILCYLKDKECIAREEITVVGDSEAAQTPGIRLEFNLGSLLGFYNNRIISKENLVGILGSFGIPRL